jgi:tetratricopeptide (TPR) repeat protein
MALDGLLVFACALLTSAPMPSSANAGPSEVDAALPVQNAMSRARGYLQSGDARSAVLVLESQIARIDGNRRYLQLLASAYRKYVKDLALGDRPVEARKYLERLCILEPDAARDRSLLGGTIVPAKTKETKTSVTLPAKQGFTARAKGDEDPFDRSNEFKQPAESTGAGGAAQVDSAGQGRQAAAIRLIEQAQAEFKNGRYATALTLFEEAGRADPDVANKARDAWAYCKLHGVAEQLNAGDEGNRNLDALEKEVQSALTMSSRLAGTAEPLLKAIAERRNGAGTQTEKKEEVPSIQIRHLEQQDAQGWQIAETGSFRIFHNQPRDLVDKVGRVAEQTRLTMQRKWFGKPLADWSPKCSLYLHADGREYQRFTGVPAVSPGHSRMETDGDRVVSRRIYLRCDKTDMITSVLPHETTHVVLAGQLGKSPVPRWADEGMAVLAEPESKIAQHNKNLIRCRADGLLFSVRDLMSLDDYPQSRRIGAFYAQSVSLVDFMSKEAGPVVFSRFLRDARQDGYEPALQKHYKVKSFEELQERWSQKVFGSSVAEVASGRDNEKTGQN